MKRIISALPIVGILILGAFLRLYRIADYMTFLGDEGRDVLVVYNILHGHFTLLGPTSSVGGFFLGPIYYYFMAPFLWLFRYDPVGPAVMVALFGIVTIWFVYKIGNEFFNTTTGIIAALLFAVSPLVIAYSRSSWNPNLMPIFTIFTLYSVYKAFSTNNTTKRTLLFLLSGFCLGILLQLHYLGTFVGAIVFMYVLFVYIISRKTQINTQKLSQSENQSASWRFRQSEPLSFLSILKTYALIFIGFVIGLSPYIAFEARHGFPNTMSIFSFIFHSQDVSGGGNFFMTLQNVFFRLFGRLVTNFPPPERVSVQAHPNILVWYIFTLALGLLSVGYFLWNFYKSLRAPAKQSQTNEIAASPAGRGPRNDELRIKFLQYSLLCIWFFVGIFLFGFYKKNIYDYYFEFLFPLPFLFLGFFLSFMLSKKIYWKIFAIAIIGVLLYINYLAIPFRFIPNKQLAQTKQISQFVLDKTENKPYNFALITGGNSDHAYRYFFTIWNRPPVTILNPSIDPKRQSVTSQLLIVCEAPCAPLGNSLWEVAGFGRAEIESKWHVSVVDVYKLVHYHGKE